MIKKSEGHSSKRHRIQLNKFTFEITFSNFFQIPKPLLIHLNAFLRGTQIPSPTIFFL